MYNESIYANGSTTSEIYNNCNSSPASKVKKLWKKLQSLEIKPFLCMSASASYLSISFIVSTKARLILLFFHLENKMLKSIFIIKVKDISIFFLNKVWHAQPAQTSDCNVQFEQQLLHLWILQVRAERPGETGISYLLIVNWSICLIHRNPPIYGTTNNASSHGVCSASSSLVGKEFIHLILQVVKN